MRFIIKRIFKSVATLPEGLHSPEAYKWANCYHPWPKNRRKWNGSKVLSERVVETGHESTIQEFFSGGEQENMNLKLPLFLPSDLLSGMLIQLTQPKTENEKPLCSHYK